MRYGIFESPKPSGLTPDSPPAIESSQSNNVQSTIQNSNFTKNSQFQFGTTSQDVDSVCESLNKFQLGSFQNERLKSSLLQKTNETLLSELKALKLENKRIKPIGAAWEEYVITELRSKVKSLESENNDFKIKFKSIESIKNENSELDSALNFEKQRNTDLSKKVEYVNSLQKQVEARDATELDGSPITLLFLRYLLFRSINFCLQSPLLKRKIWRL